MSKYSSQFKLKVVQEYLKLGGLKRLAKLYSINTSDVRNWTLTYQANGLPGLQKRSHQRYTLEFKIAVLKYMKLNLISARPAAAHFNIARQALSPSGSASTMRVVLQPCNPNPGNDRPCQNTVRLQRY